MGLFDKIFGDTKTNAPGISHEINVTKDGLIIDGNLLTSLKLSDLARLLGTPRFPEFAEGESFQGNRQAAIWDETGVYVKYDGDNVTGFELQLDIDENFKPKFDVHKWRPGKTFNGHFLVEGLPYQDIKQFEKTKYPVPIEKHAGNWKVYFVEVAEPSGTNHFRVAEVVYEVPRISSGKYKIQHIDGETLYFKNFNFKLAIIQALMFDKELLKPKFDVYEFADDYIKREIDVDGEGDEPILEVKRYFRDLPINKALANEVTEIYLDGGNDIYLQICPQWDGEDNIFDIANIEEAELAQFPNLKKITAVMMRFKAKTRNVLQAQGIELINPKEGIQS